MFPSNSGTKPHKATMWTEGAPPFCSCKGYIFGRSRVAKSEGIDQRKVFFLCKHLETVVGDTCDWAQKSEADYQHTQQCPKCGSDVVDTDDSMVPLDPEATVHDLRVMLAEMTGTPLPPPLQRPTPHVVIFTETTMYRTVVDALTVDEARAKVLNSDCDCATDDELDSKIEVVDAFEQKPKDVVAKPTPTPIPAPGPAAVRRTLGSLKGTSAKAAASDLASLVKPATTARRR